MAFIMAEKDAMEKSSSESFVSKLRQRQVVTQAGLVGLVGLRLRLRLCPLPTLPASLASPTPTSTPTPASEPAPTRPNPSQPISTHLNPLPSPLPSQASIAERAAAEAAAVETGRLVARSVTTHALTAYKAFLEVEAEAAVKAELAAEAEAEATRLKGEMEAALAKNDHSRARMSQKKLSDVEGKVAALSGSPGKGTAKAAAAPAERSSDGSSFKSTGKSSAVSKPTAGKPKGPAVAKSPTKGGRK